MTRRLIQNFRGVNALVIHAEDRNRTILTETLTRLGLKIHVSDPSDAAAIARQTRRGRDRRLRYRHDRRCGARISKRAHHGAHYRNRWARSSGPITTCLRARAVGSSPQAAASAGIYSALFFATNEHHRRHEIVQKIQLLEGRHRSRRFVTRAIVHLMRDRGIDDEEAFRLLRKESMRRRLTIEEYAVHLAANPREAVKKAREA